MDRTATIAILIIGMLFLVSLCVYFYELGKIDGRAKGYEEGCAVGASISRSVWSKNNKEDVIIAPATMTDITMRAAGRIKASADGIKRGLPDDEEY